MSSATDAPIIARPWWQQHLLTRALRRLPRLAVLLIIVGLTWRAVRYGVRFPVWGDEAFVAVNFIERDFAGLTRMPLQYTQIVPLGFMWTEEAVSRALGFSEPALRLVPFACGVAGLLLLWRLAGRMLDRRGALLAVAIAAAGYYLVRHAAEVKPYAGDFLVSVALTSLAWSIHTRGGSPARWTALAAVALGGAWLSFPATFVAGGAELFLAWRALRQRNWAALAAVAAVGALIGASSLAMYLTYAAPMARNATQYWEMNMWQDSFPPMHEPWLLPLWLVQVHAGAMFAHPSGGNSFGSTATLVAVLAGCAALWRRGRSRGAAPRQPRTAAPDGRAALGLLLLPFATSLAAAALGTYPYGGSARVALHLAPAVCLLAGAGISYLLRRLLPPRLVPEGIRIAAVAMAAFAMVGAVIDVATPYKRHDHAHAKQAARDLAARVAASDRVLLGLAKEVGEADRPLPRIRGTDAATIRYYLHTFLPTPLGWAPDEPTPYAGRTWLLFYSVPRLNQTDPDANEPARSAKFNAYLRKARAVLGRPEYGEFVVPEPHAEAGDMRLKAYLFAAPPEAIAH